MTMLGGRSNETATQKATTTISSGDPGARFCAVMVFVALVVPANLVVAGPIRSLGSASRIFGLIALVLVLVVFVQRDAARAKSGRSVSGSVAVPIVLLLYVIAIVGLYGMSNRRLMSPIEVDGGTRILFAALALAGAGLAAALLVTDLRGLRMAIGCIVASVGFSAFIGIIQSRLTLDLAAMLRLPGLAVNSEVSTELRNDITRVIGSAGHPIEFTVILAAVVPFALYAATHSSTKARRQWSALAAVLILVAIPLGVSRSGVIGVAVALICYSVAWTWRQRLTALAVALAGLVFYRIVQPGVLGTIFGLFSSASTDNSVLARTDDYPRVQELVAGREFIGIGPGTFLPDAYFVLDNQWLLSYVEGGVVGVVALAVVLLTGLIVAQTAYVRAVDAALRDASLAIFAAIAAMTACVVTFDLLSFQQVSFLLFFCIGLASAALVVASADRDRSSEDLRQYRGGRVDERFAAVSGPPLT